MRFIASISQVNAKFTFFLVRMLQTEDGEENRVSALLLLSRDYRPLIIDELLYYNSSSIIKRAQFSHRPSALFIAN